MAGVLIYQDIKLNHSIFISSDNEVYNYIRRILVKDNCKILYEKANTTLDKIENARKTKDNLIARLNIGEVINLEKELGRFFK